MTDDSNRPALGELAAMVLLAAANLGDEAYGAQIRRVVSAQAGRDYSVGAIYATLHRLEEKGLVTSYESEPLPVRGGRARRQFVPTIAGKATLRQAMTTRKRMWTRFSLAGHRG